nr:MAG TPA: hypothetical protein [Caudoviricetes sp.]
MSRSCGVAGIFLCISSSPLSLRIAIPPFLPGSIPIYFIILCFYK